MVTSRKRDQIRCFWRPARPGRGLPTAKPHSRAFVAMGADGFDAILAACAAEGQRATSSTGGDSGGNATAAASTPAPRSAASPRSGGGKASAPLEEGGGGGGKRPALPKPSGIVCCARCSSADTKFCYYNNYNVKQPRFYCKVRAARAESGLAFGCMPSASARARGRPRGRFWRRARLAGLCTPGRYKRHCALALRAAPTPERRLLPFSGLPFWPRRRAAHAFGAAPAAHLAATGLLRAVRLFATF